MALTSTSTHTQNTRTHARTHARTHTHTYVTFPSIFLDGHSRWHLSGYQPNTLWPPPTTTVSKQTMTVMTMTFTDLSGKISTPLGSRGVPLRSPSVSESCTPPPLRHRTLGSLASPKIQPASSLCQAASVWHKVWTHQTQNPYELAVLYWNKNQQK